MRYAQHVLLSALPEGDPPSEFLIFKAGVNETSKGAYVFDEAAAASVMAAYSRDGVDLMIDLDHESLERQAVRPDSRDARGWFKLALRNGELWAVDVRWTPDGARRLAERTQRYVSPAFATDEEGRPAYLLNVAICAMPATFDAQPLIAATKISARTRAIAYVARSILENGSRKS